MQSNAQESKNLCHPNQVSQIPNNIMMDVRKEMLSTGSLNQKQPNEMKSDMTVTQIGFVSLARLLSKRALPRTMVFCFAFGCNHRSDRHSKNDTQCHLFRFPTNVKLRKKWIELCRYVLGACF